MKYLLDTNTCIGWLRDNQPEVVARIKFHDPRDIVLCSMVVAELQFGVERSNQEHRANTALRVEQLRRLFLSLPFDDAAAEEYGRIRAELTTGGKMIGANDLVIAAIAKSRDCTLVTHNVAEFSRVSGLRIEDWQSPLDIFENVSIASDP